MEPASVARAGVGVLCAAAILSLFGTYAIDDAFIGYANAQNLGAGLGFHFNPGDGVLTTSAPLAVPLYAVLSWLFHSEPAHVAQPVAACAVVAIGFGTFEAVRRFAGPIGALCATIVALGSPTVLLLWSHESLLWIALVLWSIVAIQAKRPLASAALVGIAGLARPETVIAVAFLAYATARTSNRTTAARGVAIALAPLALWSLYAYRTTGSVVSQSAHAKHAQLLIQGYPYLEGLFVSPAHTFDVLAGHASQLVFGLVAGLLALALTQRPIARPSWYVLAWFGVSTAAYVVAQTHFFPWYGLQVPALAAYLAAFPWAGTTTRGTTLARAFAIGLTAVHAVTYGRMVFTPQARYNIDDDFVMPRLDDNAYERLGRYLAAHSPAGASVAYAEIGQLRYYSGRTVVDTIGLATPGVADHMLAHDWLWVFERYRPTIVVDEPNGWFSTTDPREADWFARAYRPAERLHFPDPYRQDPARDTFVLDRLVDEKAIPEAREIDTTARATARVSGDTNSTTIDFQAAETGIARIEIRLRARCAAARLGLTHLGRTIASAEIRHTTPSIERYTLDTAEATTGGPYALRIEGCGTADLAPPRYRPDPFAPLADLDLVVAPPAEAMDVFVASKPTVNSIQASRRRTEPPAPNVRPTP